MIAEILSTGDEIRTGAVVDSNSAHISCELEAAGIEVVRHTCVGDDMDRLVSILREIGGRADVAVVTGGLGPTMDDLTAEAAAAAGGVELIVDRAALNSIEDFLRKRGRPMTDPLKKQALLPEGAQCLYNIVGTAPGFFMKIGRCFFFFLPGVPFEMRKMLSSGVLPQIERLRGGQREFSIVKTISSFGLTESETGQRIAGLEEKFPGIKPGLRIKFPEIHIRLYARGDNETEIGRRMDAAVSWVLEKMGKYAFSADGDSMEAVVGRLLCRKKASVAVAESCTGGLISHWLTNVPGSSDYFFFSGVAYSNEAKVKVLGVSPETLHRYGAVHEETAKEMAEGACRAAGADYAVSATGIAGPGGGTDDKPVGTVCFGLCAPGLLKGFRFHYSFQERWMNKKIFAMKALDLLRRELMD